MAGPQALGRSDWLVWARGAVLFLGTLAIYLTGRSPSLDDWDSVNFAKAILRFDMRLQQPHPPGYPAYVFLARVAYTFTHDPRTALTLLSAVCGALCVLAMYALAGDVGASWAALPLAAMPLFWLNSDMAMSDVPGLLFVVAAVWLLHRSTSLADERQSWLYLLAGGAVAGFGLGVRPQDGVVPFMVLLCYTLPLRLMERKKGLGREILTLALVIGGAVLLWAVPLLRSVGYNARELWAPVHTQIQYVGEADSMLGHPVSRDLLRDRLADFGNIFSGYFGGPQDGGFNAFLGLAAGAAVLAILAGRWRVTWLALVWLLSYGAVMVLVMQPTDPRKILPAVPGLCLLMAAAFTSRGALLRRVGLICGLLLTAVLAAKAVPLVRTLHTTLTPPEQAVGYIREHFSVDDTVILAGNSLNHIYYELPQYNSVAIDFVSQDELAVELAKRPYRYVVSLDEWQTTVPLPPEWARTEDSFDFERNWLVLPKASVVPFTVYTRRP